MSNNRSTGNRNRAIGLVKTKRDPREGGSSDLLKALIEQQENERTLKEKLLAESYSLSQNLESVLSLPLSQQDRFAGEILLYFYRENDLFLERCQILQ